MRMQRRFAMLIAVCLLAHSGSAFATYFSLTFDPASPVAGQIPNALVRVGVCDTLNATANGPEIEVDGFTVRITAVGITQTVLPCNFTTFTARYPLVPLAQGTYTVEFYRRQFQAPAIVDLMIQATLVVGPAPAPEASEVVTIPSFSGYIGILTLLVTMAGFAFHRLRSGS